MKKNEIKNVVINVLESLTSEQFKKLIISLDELEIWEDGLKYDIDGINNVIDRMNVVDTFYMNDYKRYYDELKKLELI